MHVKHISKTLKQDDAVAIVRAVFERFDRVAVAFSGTEDVVLVDIVLSVKPDANIFTIDTGRLHPETYEFLEEVRNRYRNRIEVLFPDPIAIEGLVRAKGLYSFYRDGRQECCAIRRAAPLKRKLADVDAWVTGQRSDQNAAGATVEVVEAHDGGGHRIVKFNPLAHWSRDRVWAEVEMRNLPYNTLHDQGYGRIVCEPCCRPTLPHEHERNGLWWWERQTVSNSDSMSLASPGAARKWPCTH